MRWSKNLSAAVCFAGLGLLGFYKISASAESPPPLPLGGKSSTVFTVIGGEATAVNTQAVGAPASNAAAAATHREQKRVVVRDAEKGLTLQTFCMGRDGRLYAVVAKGVYDGSTSTDGGEIRVLSGEGEEAAKWTTEFVPQRIAAAPDGSIVVGGSGRLARYSAEGKLLAQVDSPHSSAVLGDKAALRKAAEAQRTESIQQYEEQIDQFKEQIKLLEEQLKKEQAEKEKADKEKPSDPEKKPAADRNRLGKKAEAKQEQPNSDADAVQTTSGISLFGVTILGGSSAYAAAQPSTEQQLRQFRQMQKAYSQMAEQQKKLKVEDIEKQIAARLQRIHGVAVGDDAVYVATAMTKGYGYAVWRTNGNFGEAKQIVSGLSGCCGQIDIQARGNELFVAENSRHRVVRYDRDGKQLSAWGKRDRADVPGGFGGCCNPMNLCFMSDGTVVTSESEGVMKCFSADGNYAALLGSAKVGGGCKNVAVAVSPDASRAYFYDQQGSQIILFEKSSAEPAKKSTDGKQLNFQ